MTASKTKPCEFDGYSFSVYDKGIIYGCTLTKEFNLKSAIKDTWYKIDLDGNKTFLK